MLNFKIGKQHIVNLDKKHSKALSAIAFFNFLCIFAIFSFGFVQTANANSGNKYLSVNDKKIEQDTEEIYKKIFIQTNEIQQEYSKALEEINLYSIFDAKFINADKDLAKSKKIIADSRKIIQKYKKLSLDKTYNLGLKEVKKLNLSPKDKKEFILGFKQGFLTNLSFYEKSWALEFKVIQVFEETVNFLDNNRDDWEVNDEGGFGFYSDESLNKFTVFISSLEKLGKEQEELVKSNLNKGKKNFSNADAKTQKAFDDFYKKTMEIFE